MEPTDGGPRIAPIDESVARLFIKGRIERDRALMRGRILAVCRKSGPAKATRKRGRKSKKRRGW